MKIFATADLHLGMKFSTFDEKGEQLSLARFTALRRCIDTANDEKCDLFVIAGDLFDRQNISGNDITAAAELFSGFAGSAILILPGNHDFFTGIHGKPWGDFLGESENASVPLVLLSDTRAYELDRFDLPVTVLPGPCTAKHSATDTISWISDRDDAPGDTDRLILGIAHGSVEGLSPDFNGDYYPMTQKQLEEAQVSLWIIGHTHRPFPEAGAVNPRLFVPGTPEPDGFDCRHAGGGWILECSGAKLDSYRRIDTGTFQFYDKQVEIDRAEAIGTAVSVINHETALVSLRLTGALDRQDYEKIPGVIENLRESFFYLRADLDDLEEMVSRDTVDEEFPAGSFPHRLITTLLDENDAEAAQLAYRVIREAAR